MSGNERAPFASLLVEPIDEHGIAATWRRIEARRERGRQHVGFLAGATAAAMVAMGIAWWASRTHEQPVVRNASVQTVAPSEAVEVASQDAPRQVSLPSGTQVELQPGTRLAPRRSTATRREWALERGRARFEVPPQHGREFAVIAGKLSVEVIGTAFSVQHDATGTRVEVEHGRVRVRTPEAPEGTLLAAGQTLRWAPRASTPANEVDADEADTDVVAPSEPPEALVPEDDPATTAPQATPPWRVAVNRGDLRGAFRLLGARGHARAVRSATDAQTLLALADMARIAGEPVSAALALERLIERHPRHAEAALSALMLGRIELDDLDRPARAVRALQRALDGGLPAALQEDALARLVEAAARAGDTTTATRAASEHRRRFPTGRWRARVDRFVEPP